MGKRAAKFKDIKSQTGGFFKKYTVSIDSSCCICMEDYADDTEVIALDCQDKVKHVFHKECLVSWVSQKNQCPMCRKSIK
mmetsp:Transcript_17975/g.30593  ORF Transcript_17975/g.30593 Transcript_17975/m.30593 type:complete len:80 (+) Transcript_17975:1327-1566(+)